MFERLSMHSIDDITLVEKAKTNERYFARLYDRYVDVVFRFVRWKVASDQDAEDIVSKTFMAVAAQIKDYDTSREQKFSTWLLAIANYKYLDHMREIYNEKEHEVVFEDDFDPDYEQDFAKLLTNKQLYDEIIDFVQRLSDRQSSIFFLRYVEEYSNKEIAEICDIDPKTVSCTLSIVAKKIQQHIDAMGYTNHND